MKIIKNNKKLFIGICVTAVLLAALPCSMVYILLNSSVGIEPGDTETDIQRKINDYFEGNRFTEDIINSMRRKATGDFNVYSLNPNSDAYNKIEEKIGVMLNGVIELSRLEEGKNYNIKIYSDFYEGENKVKTEELLSKDIVGSEKIHMIYGTGFMTGGSKRELTIYFIENQELLETLEYYIPSNYNEAGSVVDADFNINEDIPIMSFTRGYKVNDKYKTYSPKLHKSKDKIEDSIKNNLSKNEKMVILRLEVNES